MKNIFILLNQLDNLLNIKYKGGRGSGNYGHSGRPGKRGGSGAGMTFLAMRNEFISKLPNTIAQSIKNYSGIDFASVNGELRATQGKMGYSTDPWARKNVRNLDTAFNYALRLSEPTTLYRGLEDVNLNLNAGDNFKDFAYLSTTIDKKSAERYAGGGVLVEFRLPKGFKFIPGEEREYILNRGQSFKVVDTGKNKVVVEP